MTSRRLVLAAAGAVLGFAVFGVLTAVLGAVAGYFAAHRPHLVSVSAVSLTLATALFAATEHPLDLESFSRFAETRPLSNATGRLAGVAWLLAAIVGWSDSRSPVSNVSDRESLAPRPGRSIAATAEIMAIIGGGAALASLAVLGDRTWAWSILPIAVGALVLLAARHLPKLLEMDFTVVVRLLPGRSEAPTSGPENVVSGSAWMLAGTTVVSIGSFVFWVVAARTATQESVGAAAALFSVVTFLNYATSLGLPIALTRFARDDGADSSVLFTWTLVLTTLSSLLGVAIFAALSPGSVTSAVGSPFGWMLLTANVAGMSLSVLIDVRCMTLRLWKWVFWRSTAISVIRLPLLFVVPDDDSTLFLFNVVAGAYSVTGVAWLVWMILKSRDRLRLRPAPPDTAIVARFASVNYLGQLAIQGPFFAVPLIALTTLSPEENASFYLAWGIMSVVVISVQIVGQVLLVEGDRSRDLVGQARVALAVGLGVSILALAVVVAAGSLIEGIYGSGYDDVPRLLVILVAGTIPYTVTVIGLSYARVRADSRATIVITFAFAALVLVPALLLTDGHGANGAAWAWFAGNLASAIIVALSHPGQENHADDRSDPIAGALEADGRHRGDVVDDPVRSETLPDGWSVEHQREIDAAAEAWLDDVLASRRPTSSPD